MAADRTSSTRLRVQTVAWVHVAVLSIGGVLVSCTSADPTATTVVSSTAANSPEPASPFATQEGFAWLTAACGSPSVVDASPNSWLPGASTVAICVTPLGRPPVLVGVYDDRPASDADLGNIRGLRGYAIGSDGDARTWVFVLEGPDSAPLRPLERYGFILH